jgi:hypothetical protein
MVEDLNVPAGAGAGRTMSTILPYGYKSSRKIRNAWETEGGFCIHGEYCIVLLLECQGRRKIFSEGVKQNDANPTSYKLAAVL